MATVLDSVAGPATRFMGHSRAFEKQGGATKEAQVDLAGTSRVSGFFEFPAVDLGFTSVNMVDQLVSTDAWGDPIDPTAATPTAFFFDHSDPTLVRFRAFRGATEVTSFTADQSDHWFRFHGFT